MHSSLSWCFFLVWLYFVWNQSLKLRVLQCSAMYLMNSSCCFFNSLPRRKSCHLSYTLLGEAEFDLIVVPSTLLEVLTAAFLPSLYAASYPSGGSWCCFCRLALTSLLDIVVVWGNMYDDQMEPTSYVAYTVYYVRLPWEPYARSAEYVSLKNCNNSSWMGGSLNVQLGSVTDLKNVFWFLCTGERQSPICLVKMVDSWAIWMMMTWPSSSCQLEDYVSTMESLLFMRAFANMAVRERRGEERMGQPGL